MKWVYFSAGGTLVILFVIMSAYIKPNTPNTIDVETSNYVQRVKAPKLPQSLDFASEEVPLSETYVLESLDREMLANCFRHSYTFLLIKRANKFFPIIEPILKKNKIPSDFKYLAVAESNLSNAISPAGAKGFWQFMKSTAKTKGLEVNSEVDERYHLEKATQAACDYLWEAYRKFGSWTLAAASYNMGMSGLGKQRNFQNVDSYYDLKLNAETARYIFRILAFKLIMTSPLDYGFEVDVEDLYSHVPATRRLDVDTTVLDWSVFAQHHGSTYKELKMYNPWLISRKLTNKYQKTYQIRLP